MEDKMYNIRKFIGTFFEPKQIIEVRVIYNDNKILSGFYNDREALFRDVSEADNDPCVKGIYTVMNEINPELINERQSQTNRLYYGKATKAKNIIRRKWLVLDFDPIKATTSADSSSTDDEKEKANQRADECAKFLTENGFPEPIKGDSGNGAHRIYSIDLPVNQETYDMIDKFFAKLNELKYGVDVTMKDASRISKMYGTTTRKGANTIDRPHRMSRIISIPEKIKVATQKNFEKVIARNDDNDKMDNKTKTGEIFTMPEGPITERHPVLKSLVTSMVARKNSYDAIIKACQAENERFTPPKTKEFIDQEVRSLYQWAINAEENKKTTNDTLVEEILEASRNHQRGVSDLFIKEFRGTFVFDHGIKRWYEFGEHSWKRDSLNEPLRLVTTIQEKFSMAMMLMNMKIKDIESEKRDEEELISESTEPSAALEETKTPRLKEIQQKIKQATGSKNIISEAIRNMDQLAYRKQVVEFASDGKESLGVSGNEWDKDPWLLGCKNGVLNLKTGEFRNGIPEDYIKSTCQTDYDTSAKCPKFEKFIREICNENLETVAFIQRFFGMGLIGDSVFKQFVLFLSGRGRNGKDTLVHAIEYTIGEELTWVIKQEMVSYKGGSKSQGSADPEVLALRGKRIVFIPECEATLDMTKVKSLSGAGTLSGRAPYADKEITFKQTHVLVIQTNRPPSADPTDYAFWKRVKCVNFELSYPDDYDEKTAKPFERKPNSNLINELREESSGILNWLLDGCREFIKDGLNDPESVKVAKSDYMNLVDIPKRWMDDECITDPSFFVRSGELYDRYKFWCKKGSIKEMSNQKFAAYLKSKGYTNEVGRHQCDGGWSGTMWFGIKLKSVLELV